MIHKPLMMLVGRVSERWRDRLLTALTVLIALDLFIVVPLGATHAITVFPFSISIFLLLVAGLLMFRRAWCPPWAPWWHSRC
jgi:uncharacterized membrane protein